MEPACPDGPDECLHWVVKVRRDQFWHDGTPVTEEDAEYTFRSLMDPRTGSPFRGDLVRKIASVEARDGGLHIFLRRPVATLMADLSVGLVPRHILEPRGGLSARFGEGDGEGDGGSTVGCGPYRLMERHGDQKVVLERVEETQTTGGNEAQTPRFVVVRTVADEATRVLAVMSGSADLAVNNLSPPIVRRIQTQADAIFLHRKAACTTYISLNLLIPQLRHKNVRKALYFAINRESIIREQFEGMAHIASGLLPSFHWAHDPDLLPFPYDPEEANRLLDKAGFPRDPATGIRFRLTLKTTTDRFRRSIGSVLAHQWNKIGIEVSVVSLELSTFLSDVRSGNFEMYILQVPEVVEPDILRWLLHSQGTPVLTPQAGKGPYGEPDRTLLPPSHRQVAGPYRDECEKRWWPWVKYQAAINWLLSSLGSPVQLGNGNRGFFFDPSLDCLLDLGFMTMNSEARKGYYSAAEHILMEELPVLPLWHEDNVAILHRSLEGYRLLPINRYSPITRVVRRASKTE